MYFGELDKKPGTFHVFVQLWLGQEPLLLIPHHQHILTHADTPSMYVSHVRRKNKPQQYLYLEALTCNQKIAVQNICFSHIHFYLHHLLFAYI